MNERKSINKFKLRNDVLLIISLLLVASLAMLYLFVFRKSGNVVQVTVDGELYATYSLSDTVTEDIHSGSDGRAVNRLVICDGKAYVESASCPDGICVSHRPVFRDGESIVCLPNRVVVTVINDEDEGSPDIVS